MLENKFKTKLIKEIKKRFPGCLVVHLDPKPLKERKMRAHHIDLIKTIT